MPLPVISVPPCDTLLRLPAQHADGESLVWDMHTWGPDFVLDHETGSTTWGRARGTPSHYFASQHLHLYCNAIMVGPHRDPSVITVMLPWCQTLAALHDHGVLQGPAKPDRILRHI